MKIVKSLKSKDSKTTKHLQITKDGHIIETGYYNLDEHIVCISSQIGCPMNCVFCATAKPIDQQNPDKAFIRNLASEEIVQQVKNVFSRIKKNGKPESKKILLSYMGMGEPFLNYENVIKSIETLSQEFPDSRTTISTIGINPVLIRKLAHEKINTVLKLHLSLHAPNNKLRKKLLPKTKSIQSALRALKYFSEIRKTPAKINYILIKGINDSKDHAMQLANLLKPYPFTVKLSNLNNFDSFQSADMETFNIFEETLTSREIKTCRFISTGTDIKAGCGQLKRSYFLKTNPL
jgi:23S rRNA (adenine2503-C2)-methyltransferase